MTHLLTKLARRLASLFRTPPDPLPGGYASPAEFLLSLPPWDGKTRNRHWLGDFLGAQKTEYSKLVGQFFLRAMVNRALHPGCKFDYCLILEGSQGRVKSSAIEILSAGFFGDIDPRNERDSFAAMQGKWLVEITELGELIRGEAKQQKSFLTRREDEYRPPYGRLISQVPRQFVFVGTNNEAEYLNDTTASRRFWPITCHGPADLDGLRKNIHQMFAEALHDFRSDQPYWPDADEQRKYFTPEQIARGMQEPYDDQLARWVEQQRAPFSMHEAGQALGLPVAKMTPAMVTRLGIALHKLGCGRVEKSDANTQGRTRLYTPPVTAHQSSVPHLQPQSPPPPSARTAKPKVTPIRHAQPPQSPVQGLPATGDGHPEAPGQLRAS